MLGLFGKVTPYIKPKRKVKILEPGNADCGDDLSGPRPEMALLGAGAGTEGSSATPERLIPVCFGTPRGVSPVAYG